MGGFFGGDGGGGDYAPPPPQVVYVPQYIYEPAPAAPTPPPAPAAPADVALTVKRNLAGNPDPSTNTTVGQGAAATALSGQSDKTTLLGS